MLLLACGAIVVLFAIFAYVLFATDALLFNGTDPTAKVVSATLALVGGFVAAVLSLIGALLKHSIDLRSEMRLEAENERAAMLSREAEDRLQLEAVIRAVQLFGSQVAPALPIQRAGALIALSSLRQHALAVSLAGFLLSRNELEASTTAQILDRALMSDDLTVQIQAADTLFEYAASLLTPGSYDFPRCIVEASVELPDKVREWIPRALARMLMARPRLDWNGWRLAAVAGILRMLYRSWKNEPIEQVRTSAGAILHAVSAAFPEISRLSGLEGRVDLDELRPSLPHLVPADAVAESLLHELDRWRHAASQE